MMKKKLKFHCLEIDSSSYDENSSSYEESSDDSIPDKNVPIQIPTNSIQQSISSQELKDTNAIEDPKRPNEEPHPELNPEFFPPPLPSQPSSDEENSRGQNLPKNRRRFLDEEETINSPEIEDSISTQIASIPDDLAFDNDDEPEPPEVEEAESVQKEPIHKTKRHARKKIHSLKAKNKPMTHDAQLIQNTNIIYEYFDQKFTKFTILKAIHAHCGDFRTAILALSQNPRQFDNVSLFEPPTEKLKLLDAYLK